MAYTEARARANKKWNDENTEQITTRHPKGMKEVYKDAAAAAGLSLNAWVRQAMEEKLDNQVTE